MIRPSPADRRTRVCAREVAGYLLIVGLAWGLRLSHLDGPSLRGDEAFGYFFAQQPIGSMLRAMVTTEPHPPLFYLLFGGWMAIAGDREFSLRIFSAGFGVLSVPLVGAVGRRLFGRTAGTAAAAMIALAPLQVWNSQDARMFTLAVAITCLTTYLLIRMADDARRERSWPWRESALWIGLTLAGLWALYHTAFVVVFQAAGGVWLLRRTRAGLTRWLVTLGITALLYLPWLILARHALFGHGGNGLSPGLWGGLTDGLGSLTFGETMPAEFRGPWLIFFALALAVSIGLAFREDRANTVFALLYLLVPAGIVIGLALIRPVYQPRYLISAQPGAALLLGAGLAALSAGLTRTTARRLGAGTLILVLTLGSLAAFTISLNHYWHDPRFRKAAGWRPATDHLQAHHQPGDFVILNVPDPSFGYYYRDPSRSAVIPAGVPVDRAATGRALATLAAEHPRLWLIPFRSPTWDAEGFVEEWLDRNARLIEQREFENVRLRLFETARPDLQAATPVQATFNNGISLIGYRLTPPADQSAPVRLTLYWQAARPPTADYTVFVHLEDSTGHRVAQQDNPPRRGTYPTSRWLPDEVVKDTYEIAVPTDRAAGAYTVIVGLYQAGDGRRAALPNGDTAFHLTDLSLG